MLLFLPASFWVATVDHLPVSSNLLLSHQPLPGSSIFCPSLAFVSKLLNMRHLMLYVLVTPNENVNIFSGLPSCNSSFHSRHYYSVTNHLWHSSLPCMDSVCHSCVLPVALDGWPQIYNSSTFITYTHCIFTFPHLHSHSHTTILSWFYWLSFLFCPANTSTFPGLIPSACTHSHNVAYDTETPTCPLAKPQQARRSSEPQIFIVGNGL